MVDEADGRLPDAVPFRPVVRRRRIDDRVPGQVVSLHQPGDRVQGSGAAGPAEAPGAPGAAPRLLVARDFSGRPAVDGIKLSFSSSLTMRPNKLEPLSLETLSSQVLAFEGKALANPIGVPF